MGDTNISKTATRLNVSPTMLADYCQWLNILDGIFTAQTLTHGHTVELNLFMAKLWTFSPIVYGSVKFWLFLLGIRLLERSKLPVATHKGILLGVLVMFLAIDLWHVHVFHTLR